ncbi:HepT-like ribonuclease domain-containing protein [Sedimentibacter sp. MB31-C6]|uniref:HepT-like ribonuclease domain-containing protein n=1 Tax=Sedimentibacter sp. MB31-C6 TaxID=3109366 RepID=UPI002DDD6B62|nr:HepT-like ribonuclease domain-containing protein [Sedimentibacter sp. MB36-C1]WSI04589.1 HepT-like ribonuclease domain-containing protein [Sedimentibacter sp. MB36-C1]
MKNQKIIQKIINYIDSVLKYTSNTTYDEFRNNSMMAEACVFNLSQIGELVNKLDKEYIVNNPEIPWFKMKGLRNRLVHDYEGVNLKLIWEIIEIDIIVLKKKLSKLYE